MIIESIISAFEPHAEPHSADYDAALHRRCGGCAYDLRGLPCPGVCPECGGGYDARTMVVYGWPGRTRNPVARNAEHARRGLMVWSVMAISICGALLMDHETEQAMTLGLLFAPIILAYLSLAGLGSEAPGPARAQLSTEGVGQCDDFGRVRLVRWSPRHEVRVSRISKNELRLRVRHVSFGIPWKVPVDVVIRTRLSPIELENQIAALRR